MRYTNRHFTYLLTRKGELLHLLTTGVSASNKTWHRPVERRFQCEDRVRDTDWKICFGNTKWQWRKIRSICTSEWLSSSKCNGSAARQANVHLEITWRSPPEPNRFHLGAKEMVEQRPKVQILPKHWCWQWPHTGLTEKPMAEAQSTNLPCIKEGGSLCSVDSVLQCVL